MKKRLVLLILIVVLGCPTLGLAQDGDDIKFLYVGPYADDGPWGGSADIKIIDNMPRYIFFSKQDRPILKDGRTYLPLRLIFHILGYNMEWKKDDPNITIYGAEGEMVLNTSNRILKKDQKEHKIDLVLLKDRYFIALRNFAEITGDSITWDEATRTVIYVKKGNKLKRPSVTIEQAKYVDTHYDYAISEVDGKKTRENMYNDIIDFVLKNTSGKSIPKSDLKVLSKGSGPGAEEGQMTWPLYVNHKKEISLDETIKLSTRAYWGKYEIIIVGVSGIDDYLETIIYMTPPPDA